MDYIKEIPSDSQISKIEIEGLILVVTIDLGVTVDGKDQLKVVFSNFQSMRVMEGYNRDLERIMIVAVGNLKRYQVISSGGNETVAEFVASSYSVE